MILRLGRDGAVALTTVDGRWASLSRGDTLPPWVRIAPDRPSVEIVRTPDTCADLYHMTWEGAWYACDALRPLVEMLPPGARTIPEPTRAYLRAFRSLPYAHAIVGPIRRVHMFEVVTSSPRSDGFVLESRVEALRVEPTIGSLEEASAHVGEALERAVRNVDTSPGTLLLSGGVDSTLLATYCREEPLRYAVTVPGFTEYAIETTYAREAASLLGVPLEEIPAPVAKLQETLVDAVQRSLQPPNHTQTVLLYTAFRSAPGTYVTAQFADALFGFGRSVTGYAAGRLRPILAVAGALPLGSLYPARLRSALRVHRALARDPGDASSWTATYARYLSAGAAERLVGRDMLAALSAERWRTSRATYPGPQPDAADAPMAYGQWLDYVHDDAIAIWSAMATSLGATLVAPHHSTTMISASHAIRCPLRYSDAERAKPVLRHMLGERLSSYSLTKRKLGSGLPMREMVERAYPDLVRDFASDELAEHRFATTDSSSDASEAIWSVLAAGLWESAVASAAARV